MITLTLNGDPLPPILTANVFVELDILVDGQVPLQTEWSVWTVVEIARGTGPKVMFRPVTPVTHYISVRAVKGDGSSQTQGFTVQVSATRVGPVEVWIDWSKLRYRKTDTLEANIVFADPQGLGYQRVSWNLYRNSIWLASGATNRVRYENADHGVYRIVAQVVDYQGDTITGDSSVVISGDFEVQGTLKPQPGQTMQFLGYVYTGEQIGEASFSSSIGMAMSAMAEEIYLLPGTTYFQVEIDPGDPLAPSQVVVRTPTGNWSVKGQPPGAIDLPYEFRGNTEFIPAPADLRLQLSTEAFATGIGSQPAFNFRVRIRCFYDGKQIYRFHPCDKSMSVGGAGQRARRFTVLFSDVDLLTDADTTEQRLGSPASTLVRYTTDLPEFMPLPLSLDGKPDNTDETHRMFYTDQNWVTSYDPQTVGALEVDANSTYAIEQARPFSMSFMMPAYPTIIQRPRRLTGRVAVYLANGYVNAGTVVTIGVLSAGGYSLKSVSVPITADAFSPDLASYVKIGEASVDIADDEFIDNGIVGIVTLDETAASLSSWPLGETRPDPVPLQGTVYSTATAAHARFDGACYYNAGPVQVLMGTTTGSGTYTVDAGGTIYSMVADIVACYDPKCVPVGLYCYGEFNGTTTLHVPQPLYNPAPFVAPGNQVTRCYCNPCLLETWIGTNGTLPPYPPFVAYSNGSMCGIAHAYEPCNGVSDPLVVPYPGTSVPPDFLAYAGTCFHHWGTVAYTSGYMAVSRADVQPVYDCQDVLCTGSVPGGMVVRYQDFETNRDVDVYMNHLDSGIPQMGVILETYDDGVRGLTTGSRTLTITKKSPEQLVLNVVGTGTLDFTVSAAGQAKQLIRYRNKVPTAFDLRVGVGTIKIDVLPNDQISYRMFAQKATQVTVSWQPWVPRPRLYATGTFTQSTVQHSFTASAGNGTYSGTLTNPPPEPFGVRWIANNAKAFRVTWNTLPGNTYYVVASNVFPVNYYRVSPDLTATGSSLSWTVIVGAPFMIFAIALASGTPHPVFISGGFVPATEAIPSQINPNNPDQVVMQAVDYSIYGTYTYSNNTYRMVFPYGIGGLSNVDMDVEIFHHSAIRAVGFTGLTDRSEYAFYGTLPADVARSEVNPDSILTVTSQGTEYVVIRARGITDSPPALPVRSRWYAQDTPLVGPWVFKLYAGREDAGQNGDMDVWVEQSGTLPNGFFVNDYQSLIKRGNPPPTNRPPEIERNSLRVIPFYSDHNTHRFPSAYVASGGDRIVVHAPISDARPPTIAYGGTTFTWAGTCPGLAFRVV